MEFHQTVSSLARLMQTNKQTNTSSSESMCERQILDDANHSKVTIRMSKAPSNSPKDEQGWYRWLGDLKLWN